MANKTIDFFLTHTQEAGDCLEWTRCFNTDGYPRAAYKGSSNGKVHRIVYELAHPEEDITGKVIRHTCDNIKCINPSHLISGTPADNNRDRDTRERHTLAVFTEKEVRTIRQLYDTGNYSQKELADMLGVNYRTIQQLVRRKSYRWVP